MVLVSGEETLDTGFNGTHTPIITYVEPGVIMGP